jgi:hypothetical protein
MTSLPSLYPDPQRAVEESPVPTNRDLRLSFQQFTLAINISETVLFLHRPYFARALHARELDAARTEFGPSYLAVVERSSVGATFSAVNSCLTAGNHPMCRRPSSDAPHRDLPALVSLGA